MRDLEGPPLLQRVSVLHFSASLGSIVRIGRVLSTRSPAGGPQGCSHCLLPYLTLLWPSLCRCLLDVVRIEDTREPEQSGSRRS